MNYIKLPFNFKYNDNNVLMVNQVGEHLFVSYDDFNSFVDGKLNVENPIYTRLKAKHFLTVDDEKELVLDMLSTKLRTRKEYLLDFTCLHMIVITLRCNCLCRYCHASSVDFSNKKYDMSWETAKKTMDMIFQTPSKDIKIEYQGGEPLLNWEVLKQSVLYAEFLNKIAKKKLGFVICTRNHFMCYITKRKTKNDRRVVVGIFLRLRLMRGRFYNFKKDLTGCFHFVQTLSKSLLLTFGLFCL